MKQVALYTATGRPGQQKIKLPDRLFGQKPNPVLLAQAVRVYQWHEHPRRAKTKTRAEVIALTGAKIWRQKGTGRARHGSKRAPIFVGGGRAHGPRGVRKSLSLSKKLLRAALISALSDKLIESRVILVDVGKIEPKTKIASDLFKKLGLKKTLVLHGGEENFIKASRNISGISLIPARIVNAYQVIKFPNLLLTKGGLEQLSKTFER